MSIIHVYKSVLCTTILYEMDALKSYVTDLLYFINYFYLIDLLHMFELYPLI